MRRFPSLAILRTQSDERLVALVRGGSESAFEAIVERYGRQLQRACRRVLSQSRAEDATQQAFIAAWVALQRGDDVTNLRAWLLRIARNTSLNALRVPGYEFAELRESLATDAAPQEELERREVMRQTLAGLAALPERQREALLRSAVEGVPYADLAREFGLSQGATRQLVMRARTSLRAAMTAVVPWPLVQWIALSARADGALRIAQIAAASGGAGATALIPKAAVVAAVVVSVAAGPSILSSQRDGVVEADAATPVVRSHATRAAEHATRRRPAASTSTGAEPGTGAGAAPGHGSRRGAGAPSADAAPSTGGAGTPRAPAGATGDPTAPVTPDPGASGHGPHAGVQPALAPGPQTTAAPVSGGGSAGAGEPGSPGGAGTSGSGAPAPQGGSPGEDDDDPPAGDDEPNSGDDHEDDHDDHEDEHEDDDHADDDHEDDDERSGDPLGDDHEQSEHERGSAGVLPVDG